MSNQEATSTNRNGNGNGADSGEGLFIALLCSLLIVYFNL